MKQIVLVCFLFYTCNLMLLAQNNTESAFSTTSSGLQYKIIKDSVGAAYPEAGGFITFWFDLRTSSDSIYDNQFLDIQPVGIPTPTIRYKSSIEEGFLMLTEGDSALFKLNADSLYKNTFARETPSFLQTSTIYMTVKMGKAYSKHFVDSVMAGVAAQKADAMEVYERDSIAIQKYLKAHKLKGKAAGGGVYIVKIKSMPAKAPYIVKGEIVETKYIGKLLVEGTEFDRSGDDYFMFTVGLGEVIQGWDYAFQRLKLGEKALILIPSALAYGSRGAEGAIPPDSPLLFEVDIKK